MKNFYKIAFVLIALIAVWLFVAPQHAHADRYKPRLNSWEIAAPGANTDAITDLVWQSQDPLRLTIQVDTSTIVNVMVTRSAVENALGMNANVALTAGATYTFDVHGVQGGDTINVQVETDSAIPLLAIGEVKPGR